MPSPTHFIVAAALVAIGSASAALASPVARYPGAVSPRSSMRPTVVRHHRLQPATHGWETLNASPPFGPAGAGTALLQTDGTVLVQGVESSLWWRLTPDSGGDYVNGTWTTVASLPSGYAPLYYSSAVLADGVTVINGGEYNNGSQDWTNLGAIYSPSANAWMSVNPPSGWSHIGDAQDAVLANGTLMIANCCTEQAALFNEASGGWTTTGTSKADSNDEEGWTLLPNGKVLTVDVENSVPRQSELYDPTTGAWSSAGTLPNDLVDHNFSEIGPAILRPNGTVFATGATGLTDIYDTATGAWTGGPKFPSVKTTDHRGATKVQQDIADGPASLLPNGHVLIPGSPGVYQTPVHFYEFTGRRFVPEPEPVGAAQDSTYNLHLLVLPTGQIMLTDFTNTVQVYTSGGQPMKGIAPVIGSVPATLTHGATYAISGTKFNGYSQANMYGDDASQATNYPLVRVTNVASGDVFYARTHGHSSMAVASTAPVSTNFDVPAKIELGASTLVVVANGIPSAPANVMIK